MDTIVLIVLWASLFTPASSCAGSTTPLFLTPLLEKGQINEARAKSQVKRDCLEDFVPDSFAGYLTTNKERGHNLFFWFFPATQNQSCAPILLWLNGGPGISSMAGLFWEHGPMNVDVEKSSTKYERREYSWVDHFSVIYLDNPVGTGFSYSDGGVSDEVKNITRQEYVNNMASFLMQFFEIFNEYKNNDFYIGGQSYAGKYVPSLAYYLHVQKQNGEASVNLTGIYMGAPYFHPIFQEQGYYDFLFSLGSISDSQRRKLKHYFIEEVDRLRSKLSIGEDIRSSKMYMPLIQYNGYWDNFVTGSEVDYNFLTNFIDSNGNLKKAIHAGNNPFQASNLKILDAFGNDFICDTVFELSQLMNYYKVLIYNGNYDLAVSTLAIEMALMNTSWNFQEEYNRNTSRQEWTQGEKMLGFYSLTDRFCRVVIHGAGHQVPRDKPREAIIMMKQFTRDGCVHDGEENISPYVDSSASLYQFYFASWASTLLIVIFIQLIQLNSKTFIEN